MGIVTPDTPERRTPQRSIAAFIEHPKFGVDPGHDLFNEGTAITLVARFGVILHPICAGVESYKDHVVHCAHRM